MRTPYYLAVNDRGMYEVRWSERGQHGRWRSRQISTRTANVLLAQRFLRKFIRDHDHEQEATHPANYPDEIYEILWEIEGKLERLKALLRSS
jgi:hypothetical protein